MTAEQYLKQILGELQTQVCVQQAQIDELKLQILTYENKEAELKRTKEVSK